MTGMTGYDLSICLESEWRYMLRFKRAGIVIEGVIVKVQTGILLVSFVVVECDVIHSDYKHLHEILLCTITHFLSLSYKDLLVVGNDILLSTLSRSRERLNQRQPLQG